MTALRVYRTARGLTQRELAAAAGVTRETVIGAETRRRHPREATLRALAYALGVEPEALRELDPPRIREGSASAGP